MEKVNKEITRLAEMLEYLDPGPEYDETLKRIQALLRLEALANEVSKAASSEKVSILERILNNGPLLNLIGGVAGTLLVINHERINIVTSRAFGWIRFK